MAHVRAFEFFGSIPQLLVASRRKRNTCPMPIVSNAGAQTGCCHGVKYRQCHPSSGGLASTSSYTSGAGIPNLPGIAESLPRVRAVKLENACQKALLLERPWRQVILNLLINHRDRLKEESPDDAPVEHSNVRGAGYYH